MTRENDKQIAQEMSDILLQIETEEVTVAQGAEMLDVSIQELSAIPASWKDKLLELCQEMLLSADDEATIGGIMERIEKAIGLIQDRD